jgi:periplasmic protein CpxP/Spy
MFKKTILAVTVLAGLSGTVAMAQDMPPPGGGFQGGHGPGPHGGPHGELPFLAGLNLTPAQHKQMHAIFATMHKDHKGEWQQVRGLHEQFEDLLLAPGPVDKTKLAALTQQMESLHQAKDAERLDIAVKIHDILTPAQLAEAKDRADKIRALHEQLHALTAPKGGDWHKGPGGK